MDVQALGQLADMQGADAGPPMEGGPGGPMGGPPTGPAAGPAAGPPQGQGNMQAGLQQIMQGVQLIETGVSSTGDPELYRMIMPMLEKAARDTMAYLGMGPQFDEAMKHDKALRQQQLQNTMMSEGAAGAAGPAAGLPPGPPPQQGPLG